jgi:inward rectifier potassium channel
MQILNKKRQEDINRDLGFGSVISSKSRQRLLNRDGSFNVSRTGLAYFATLNPYHVLLTMPWWKFFLMSGLFYLAINLLFALAFFLCGPNALLIYGNDELTPFLRAFFFSVQTIATIGYGEISPIGIIPSLLVTAESLVGLLGLALLTGILFARFSRPRADIIFSRSAVIAPYRDITAFEIRIANARRNQIIELEAQLLFAQFETDGENTIRRYYPLELERSKVAFFPLSWTVVHPINRSSPFYGFTANELAESHAEILVLLTGFDETFSQTVYARTSYKFDEIVWNAKFVNIFNPISEQATVSINVRKLHDTERVEINGDEKANGI